ncbi:hypothetical protein HAPAU_25940 [Halalkalicoccus paucihalophilus]|uniref:DUF302 domain-containing protein n=1 Tax=Halalkalicoccus paucihalophilus TaxID=1008153 RepID=A0A151AE18_9EURY|nr:DUF302 domain-containing protein [Halalkalicoccus paucihalophilus]KYH25916.1 hypothetical protein HAPAU_25940 [Halalkalicoccus paucihalophilus]
MSYTMDTRVRGEFDEVVERTTDALADEGFGVLCDVDVRRTFEEKLGKEYRQYRILGACSPSLAHRALETDLKLGTLLPCNVVVYEAEDGTVGVSAVDPETLLSVIDTPELDGIATEVRERFVRVLDSLPEA